MKFSGELRTILDQTWIDTHRLKNSQLGKLAKAFLRAEAHKICNRNKPEELSLRITFGLLKLNKLNYSPITNYPVWIMNHVILQHVT